MKTKNPFLFKPFLRKGVVGSECGWQDGRHDEGQDVQTVEHNLLNGTLRKKEFEIYVLSKLKEPFSLLLSLSTCRLNRSCQ